MVHPPGRGFPPPFAFTARTGFEHPNTRVDVRLLGPCFKTGRLQPLRQHPSRSADLSPGWPHFATGYNTPREELHSQSLYPTARTDAGLTAEECTGRKPG